MDDVKADRINLVLDKLKSTGLKLQRNYLNRKLYELIEIARLTLESPRDAMSPELIKALGALEG